MQYLLVLLQYLLPKRTLSKLIYSLTRQTWPPALVHSAIRIFIHYYKVNMQEAELEAANAYPDFNAFFTRTLKPSARQIQEATLVSPVDGTISQFGTLQDGKLIQAKNREYTLRALLADDLALTEKLQSAHFITLYLSPREYHRIHCPVSGILRQMVYVPGELFSVNSSSVQHINNLFARNERVVNYFATAIGPVVVIFVGAMLVASIATAWHGEVRSDKQHCWRYPESGKDSIPLQQGEELGNFNMGSTIILLHTAKLDWHHSLRCQQMLHYGQALTE